MTRLWIHATDDGVSDPLPTEQIAALYAAGRLNRNDEIRPTDVWNWAPLWTWLPEIADSEPNGSRPAGSWTDERPHPWRRALARAFDIFIIGGVSWIIMEMMLYLTVPQAEESYLALLEGPYGFAVKPMLLMALTIPITSLIVGTTGFSLGKWLFGIKVVTPQGRPIGVGAAFKREGQAWAAGLAFLMPFVFLITLVIGYRTLMKQGHSDWDPPSERVLLHRPLNGAQVILMMLAALLFLGMALVMALPES